MEGNIISMLTPHYVAYLDIMGFSRLVSADDNLAKYEKAIELLEYFNIIKKALEESSNDSHIVKVTAFSDNIVISVPITGKYSEYLDYLCTAHLCTTLCRFITNTGYVMRGGISKGDFYHTDSILFGKALVDAYEYEKIANYPRIIT